MTPNFALSLSFEGIRLLVRQSDEWREVGDVALTSADLAGELAKLRENAGKLGSGPLETKVIIPNEQIKFLEVDASGLSKDALHNAVQSALDGATPYPIEELAFDFATIGNTIHIAAVANETLQEAEAFATEHSFAPQGFVAIPPTGTFPNEPNFGPSKSSGRTDFSGEAAPITVAGPAIIPAPKPSEPEQPALAPDPTLSEPPKGNAPASDIPVSKPATDPAAPVPGFSSRRKDPSRDAPVTKQDAATPPLLASPPTENAPVVAAATLGAPQQPAPAPSAPPVTGHSSVTLPETEARISAAALQPGMADNEAAFAAPPKRAPVIPAASLGAVRTSGATPSAAPAETPAAPAGPSALDKVKTAFSGVAASLSAKRAERAEKRAAEKGAAASAKAAATTTPTPDTAEALADPKERERQRMTVFGARKPKTKKDPIVVGGKPRFLGLVLTALLLLFLVSVAAWASVFLDEGIARLFRSEPAQQTEIADLPQDAIQPDQSQPTTNAFSDTTEVMASLDPEIVDLTEENPSVVDGLTEIAPPARPLFSPAEAEARYAATGIWLSAPNRPFVPAPVALDDLYLPSIDQAIDGYDAIALTPVSRRLDLALSGQTLLSVPDPQVALIPATPEGITTPEGAVVFAKRPPVVPPQIPQRLAALQPAVEPTIRPTARTLEPAETTDAEADTAQAPEPEAVQTPLTAEIRPRVRPEKLIENTERQRLGGITFAELAKKRPRNRPELAKQAEEVASAQAPPTALAVAASRKPSTRPRNFSRIVAKAQEKAASEPAQTTRVAAVAPRSVKPRIPSNASVAKSATVRNAINLSRVNLIGVYGKPSSRRALVRLASGRYKKVKVGDRVDGGRVSAIGEGQLLYNKNGRSITLRMPKG